MGPTFFNWKLEKRTLKYKAFFLFWTEAKKVFWFSAWQGEKNIHFFVLRKRKKVQLPKQKVFRKQISKREFLAMGLSFSPENLQCCTMTVPCLRDIGSDAPDSIRESKSLYTSVHTTNFFYKNVAKEKETKLSYDSDLLEKCYKCVQQIVSNWRGPWRYEEYLLLGIIPTYVTVLYFV